MIGVVSKVGLPLCRRYVTSTTTSILTGSNLNESINGSNDTTNLKATKNVGIENIDGESADAKNKILKYIESAKLSEYINVLPKRLLSRKTKTKELYLMHDDTAKKIFDLIKDPLLSDPHNVIEANAGIGLITERLLDAGLPHITVIEPHDCFIKVLEDLSDKYPSRVSILQADLLNIWRFIYQDKYDQGNRLAQFLSGFNTAKWGTEFGLQIIGILPDLNVLRRLILDVVRQSGIVCYGRPRFYVCVPPSSLRKLTSHKAFGLQNYRGISVLFQILFDFEILGEIPRKSLLPWLPHISKNAVEKLPTNQRLDLENWNIVRIEGKKNLFSEVIDESHLKPLWYFLNQHMVARKARVIAHMETWEPGCGPNLIMKDYDIFTQFGDLKPHQILELFKEFTTWEGYTSFSQSLENSPEKMDVLLS